MYLARIDTNFLQTLGGESVFRAGNPSSGPPQVLILLSWQVISRPRKVISTGAAFRSRREAPTTVSKRRWPTLLACYPILHIDAYHS